MVRSWNPPSFDSAPLFNDAGEVMLPTVGELESIRSDTRKSALGEARQDGYAKGMAEGFSAGFDQGRQEGQTTAYEEARERVNALALALESALAVLKDVPQTVGADLAELAFEIGQRLSGHDSLERAPFVGAVQEALMRLPRPGETLFMRLNPAELETWQQLLSDASLPFNAQVQADPAVTPGHAFVEIDGARINVGALARRAVLRMALGLPLDSSS